MYTEYEKLLIALSYCTFLKNSEKIFLAQSLDTLQALTVLSINAISTMLARKINPRTFKIENIPVLVSNACQRMHDYRIAMASINDSNYPPLLREIPDAPFLLFYRGRLPDPAVSCVSIVGTRNPTGTGIKEALRIAAECGHNGIPVISGLARGIDTFAHRGVLEGGGTTAAVLACGADQFYPQTNKRLAARILENGGCILTEYPPGEPPLAYRFPQRNRIIAGLSRSVLIVEAPKKSGALITADFALEQGRDVCVVSSMLESPQNDGGRTLAADGAIPVDSAADFLSEWQQPRLHYCMRQDEKQLPLFLNNKRDDGK